MVLMAQCVSRHPLKLRCSEVTFPCPHLRQHPKVRVPSCKWRKSTALIAADCLFLDHYVPAKAINNPYLKLPVISWFFGGGYQIGAKDEFEPLLPFYDGTGLLQASDGNVIFVASNYRVGTETPQPCVVRYANKRIGRSIWISGWNDNGKGRTSKYRSL